MKNKLHLLALPLQMRDLRSVWQALDVHQLSAEVAREIQARLVILGPVNSGKSTLFNHLHGQKLSAVSAVPGTTQDVVEQPLGPFLLVDTPGFGEVWGVDRAEIARQAASEADLILLLFDAVAGIRQSDHELYVDACGIGVPVVIALNKVDLVRKDLPWILENTETILGVKPIPISARTGRGIAEALLPAIVEAQPAVAVAMARALPAARLQLVQRMIRRAAWLNATIALEPVPGVDIPLLLASQTRLVLRIAAAYGQAMDVSHARELLTTIAGSLLARYLGGQLAKFIPGPGWIVSALISAMSTWAIGEAARRYFEAGGQIQANVLRTLYRRLRFKPPKWLLTFRKVPQGDLVNVES
ncbi:MAG: 50S ribosome-binding GTPase [Anaerolineae bacterium]|nr:50S ribosome-binding GTPase [Anaerolineae bacterium]